MDKSDCCQSIPDCIDSMLERIVAEVDPEKVILFGSQASGSAKVDSDIDFMIIESEPFTKERSRWREATRLYLALRGFGVSKDILLYSRDEFDAWKDSLNHVVGRAWREGRVIYERH